MTQKKGRQPKKDITTDDLAVMVNNGFEALRKEMHSEIGNIREKIDDLKEETRLGFKRTDSSLMRIERRLEYQDEEIFKIKDRLKTAEAKLSIM